MFYLEKKEMFYLGRKEMFYLTMPRQISFKFNDAPKDIFINSLCQRLQYFYETKPNGSLMRIDLLVIAH